MTILSLPMECCVNLLSSYVLCCVKSSYIGYEHCMVPIVEKNILVMFCFCLHTFMFYVICIMYALLLCIFPYGIIHYACATMIYNVIITHKIDITFIRNGFINTLFFASVNFVTNWSIFFSTCTYIAITELLLKGHPSFCPE